MEESLHGQSERTCISNEDTETKSLTGFEPYVFTDFSSLCVCLRGQGTMVAFVLTDMLTNVRDGPSTIQFDVN